MFGFGPVLNVMLRPASASLTRWMERELMRPQANRGGFARADAALVLLLEAFDGFAD